MPINVKNEIAALKKVMLHRPGDELINLTPNSLKDLLFDDIPYLKIAKAEHDNFAEILRNEGVEVVYLEDLVAESLNTDFALRERFIRQFVYEAGIRDKDLTEFICSWLNSNYPDNRSLALKTMAGINSAEIANQHFSDESLYAHVHAEEMLIVPPMPNLYFTRDPFATIGTGVSINRMYSQTRNRETIYADYIFKYHPEYSSVPRYYNRDAFFHIEGGDILNINESTIAIGISQRTQSGAIDNIAKNIFESDSPIDTILAFKLPESRAFMHLDTVFTQVDRNKFTIHPAILGPLIVYELRRRSGNKPEIVECHETVQHILSRYIGESVELIMCGGGDAICADREQWNDGSNTLCVSPGRVIVYDRNVETNRALRSAGLEVLEMPSSELSRGRGGPRCMSMPLYRDDL